MKIKLIALAVSATCATAMLPISNPAFAQSTAKEATPAVTKAQVKAERDAFLKENRWDPLTEVWVPIKAPPADAAKISRAEVKAERDAFLKENRWDPLTENWVSIKATPRDLGKLTRAEVRAEAAEFYRTHDWDEASGKYVLRSRPLRAKK